MTEKHTKLTKARRSYRCHECAGAIEPGDLYRRRTVTLGASRGQSVELREGYPTTVEHGLRVSARVCQECCSEVPHHT